MGFSPPQPHQGLLVLAVCACLAVAVGLALPAGAEPPLPPAEQASQPRLVRITYQDRLQLSILDAQGWDIWEVHPGYAVGIPPARAAIQVLPDGVTLEDLGPVAPAYFDPAYHTYTSTVAELLDVASAHPRIVTLYDIGDGWEKKQGLANRDVWAVRVTSNPTASLPAVLFVANHHAREIATPEVALALLGLLANGYGQDPLITYLGDNRETWIVPMANPDGHIRAEAGLYWRKNADNPGVSCPDPGNGGNTIGVDLNRNFGYHWGGPGSSDYVCDQTYRGTAAFSEPEDQALKALVEIHNFALTVSYHSYGNLVLYPWGYTDTLPADGGLMDAMARKVASSNHYTPGQSTILYPTSGDLCDWTYGAHGIRCFTVEMGDEFMPPYSAVAGLWDENRPGALYLMNIADDLERVRGPEATQVHAVTWTDGVSVTALLSDLNNGDQAITAAECFTDVLGANGTGIPMLPADGAWDSSTEAAMVSLPVLPPGRHAVYVRGRDADGHWGSVGVAWPAPGVRLYLPMVARGGL